MDQRTTQQVVGMMEQAIKILIDAQQLLASEGEFHIQEMLVDAIKSVSRARAKAWKNYYIEASKRVAAKTGGTIEGGDKGGR